jgi:DNA-binding HxlR family transcriptional regulator
MVRDNVASSTKSTPQDLLITDPSSEDALEDESCEITEIIAILSRKWTLNILR